MGASWLGGCNRENPVFRRIKASGRSWSRYKWGEEIYDESRGRYLTPTERDQCWRAWSEFQSELRSLRAELGDAASVADGINR